MHKLLYWLISSNFLLHFHILDLKFFYTLSSQKCSIAFCLSLLGSCLLYIYCYIFIYLFYFILFYFSSSSLISRLSSAIVSPTVTNLSTARFTACPTRATALRLRSEHNGLSRWVTSVEICRRLVVLNYRNKDCIL